MRPRALQYNPYNERVIHDLCVFVLLLCVLVCVVLPGVVLGAAIFTLAVVFIRLNRWIRWTVALLLAGCFYVLHFAVVPFWLWRVWSATSKPLSDVGVSTKQFTSDVAVSILIESLLGPLVVLVAWKAITFIRRGLMGQLRFEHYQAIGRHDAVRGKQRLKPLKVLEPDPARIRLGVDRETRRPFDLAPEELHSHIFLPGATGSGKTNSVAVIAAGAIRLGFGVVIIDCKGGSLKTTAMKLATRAGLLWQLVDADDASSLGYDVCVGDPADIANKLLGSYVFSPAGEYFKNISMGVLPLVIRAMRIAGEPVTLRNIAGCLVAGRLRQIGHRAGEPYQHDLTVLAEQAGSIAEGINGLRVRLDALLQGKFGELLTASDAGKPVLDWEATLSDQTVTSINLPATAASEDVELMARVIVQDLKQQCSRRIRRLSLGQTVIPVLVVLEEFAALREPEVVVDLLLQARQAEMPTLVSTQYVPEKLNIRQAVLQSGLIIAHRLEATDAELVAAQTGTRPRWEPTLQANNDLGPSGLMSLRLTDAYVVHPNDLRSLPRGRAVVRSILRAEPAIVQVDQSD